MQQILKPVPKGVHSFPRGLDKIFSRQAGTKYDENLSPTALCRVLRDLSDYTKAFDAKYGTALYDPMRREGFAYQ